MKAFARMALAARLAALFALVTAIVFGIAGMHLYQSLDDQLRKRDDLALIGTAEIMRRELASVGDIEAAHRVIRLLDAAYGPTGIVVALKDGQGRLLAASNSGAEDLPSEAPVPLTRSVEAADLRDWVVNGGKRGRLVVAEGYATKADPGHVVVTVARTAGSAGVIIDAHGRDVLFTLLLGVLVAGALGYLVVRGALRPVEALAEAARRITATGLDARLRSDEAPRELEVLVRAFNEVLDRLQESFQRLSRFSGDIAHDLRTPVTNLIVANQVALNKERTVAEYQNILVSNVEEFERIARMIEDMLFLARADDPKTVIRRETIELREELDKVVEFYSPLAEEKGLSIRTDGSARLEADRTLVQRAIHNLLSNAIRYSRPNGEVDMAIATRDGGVVELAVTDRGMGIAKADLPHVFDRFYRADRARSDSAEGSGLGLAIVKSIAALHGGEVRVTSTPNEPTTFTLVLPCRASPSRAETSRTHPIGHRGRIG